MAAKRRRWSGIGGMTKLRRILMRIPKDSGEAITVEVSEFARRVQMRASREARSGDMASARYAQAITTKISRAGFSADVGVITAAGRKLAWFGHFIEFGTKAGFREWRGTTKRRRMMRSEGFHHPGTPARPVLLPAFEIERRGMEPRIKKAINSVLTDLSKGPDE